MARMPTIEPSSALAEACQLPPHFKHAQIEEGDVLLTLIAAARFGATGASVRVVRRGGMLPHVLQLVVECDLEAHADGHAIAKRLAQLTSEQSIDLAPLHAALEAMPDRVGYTHRFTISDEVLVIASVSERDGVRLSITDHNEEQLAAAPKMLAAALRATHTSAMILALAGDAQKPSPCARTDETPDDLQLEFRQVADDDAMNPEEQSYEHATQVLAAVLVQTAAADPYFDWDVEQLGDREVIYNGVADRTPTAVAWEVTFAARVPGGGALAALVETYVGADQVRDAHMREQLAQAETTLTDYLDELTLAQRAACYEHLRDTINSHETIAPRPDELTWLVGTAASVNVGEGLGVSDEAKTEVEPGDE